jgi:hypothetical protein
MSNVRKRLCMALSHVVIYILSTYIFPSSTCPESLGYGFHRTKVKKQIKALGWLERKIGGVYEEEAARD